MTAIIFVNGLGLDDSSYAQISENIKKRYKNVSCHKITLSGFEDNSIDIDVEKLGFAGHSQYLINLIDRIDDANIILWGFSYGADLIAYTFNMLDKSLPSKNYFFILNDPNIGESTCTISKHLADFTNNNLNNDVIGVLDALKEVIDKHKMKNGEISDVLNYLATIIHKNKKNIAIVAKDILKNASNIPNHILEIAKPNRYNGIQVYFSKHKTYNSFIKFCNDKNKGYKSFTIKPTDDCSHFYLNTQPHQRESLRVFLEGNLRHKPKYSLKANS